MSRLRRQLIRHDRQLSRLRMDARKQDTRNKIQLGGLVIKAGLGEEETAVIFGALLLTAEAINGPEGEAAKRRFRREGDRVFSAEQQARAGDVIAG